MEDNKSSFNYTYSAKEQEEIRSIRSKYSAPVEDKMERLRALDKKATAKAQTCAITLGVIGALILGTGMSLAMTNISGLSSLLSMLIGIPVGLVGIVLVALAHPVYRRVLKKARKRIAPEIIRLSDELLK